PAQFVQHLDRLTAEADVRAYKERTYDLLEPRAGNRFLDAGCGTGDDVLALGRLVGRSGQVIGVDASETMISTARERSAGSDLPVEFHVGDIYRLDFADPTFDGCRVDRVFHHLADP